jgi:hypothetical protein
VRSKRADPFRLNGLFDHPPPEVQTSSRNLFFLFAMKEVTGGTDQKKSSEKRK